MHLASLHYASDLFALCIWGECTMHLVILHYAFHLDRQWMTPNRQLMAPNGQWNRAKRARVSPKRDKNEEATTKRDTRRRDVVLVDGKKRTGFYCHIEK